VQSNGTLWSWGYNAYGQLGVGDTTQRTGPVQVGSATTWTAVACGAYHSAALQSNGYLYDWGYNTNYQLGDGTTSTYLSPRMVDAATNWTAVSCGWYDTMAQKANGSLWGWGSDIYGEQGDGASNTYQTTPKQVSVPGSVSAVCCGYYQTFSLTANGSLFAWGVNNYGQLGLGDTANRGAPTAVPRPNTSPGDDAGWSAHAVRLVGSGPDLEGSGSSFAIKANGELLAWGRNWNGCLGLGDTASRTSPTQVGANVAVGADNLWASVASGPIFTMAIRGDGTLWSCGSGAQNRPLDVDDAGETCSARSPVAPGRQQLDGSGLRNDQVVALKSNGHSGPGRQRAGPARLGRHRQPHEPDPGRQRVQLDGRLVWEVLHRLL